MYLGLALTCLYHNFFSEILQSGFAQFKLS